MRDQDIGPVALVDVDVVAEARGCGLHVHVGHTRGRGEHLLVDAVVRVQVDVVAGRGRVVAVGTMSTLRAQLLGARRERELDHESGTALVVRVDASVSRDTDGLTGGEGEDREDPDDGTMNEGHDRLR